MNKILKMEQEGRKITKNPRVGINFSILLITFLFLFSFSFVSAEKPFYNYQDSGDRVQHGLSYNISTNSTDYWVTDEGILKNVANIMHNWLSNLGWSVSGHTIDTTLEMNANPIENVSHIQFDPAGNGCLDEFCLEVDADVGSLQYSLPGGEVVNQIGFETYLGGGRVRNTEAITIDNCQAVYLVDATGSIPEIKLAGTDMGYRIAQATVGLATEDIASNQQGYVTVQGLVRGCNTSGYSAGEGLYVSQGGNLTNIPPSGNGTVFVGVVNRVHATEGEINVLMVKIPSISDVLYSRNNADSQQIKNISNGTTSTDAVNLGQLQSVNETANTAIQNNTEDGYIYKGHFQTDENGGGSQEWYVEEHNDDVHFHFDELGGNNYVGWSTTGAFMELYANPNPSNDYKMWTVTETQGADTELNIYEGGTGHNRFWSSGSVRVGGGADSLCSNLTSDVDCDTPSTGADFVVEDDIWAGGKIFAQDWTNVTITESQVSDIGNYLENIVEDTTPQLGGELDVQTYDIVTDDKAVNLDEDGEDITIQPGKGSNRNAGAGTGGASGSIFLIAQAGGLHSTPATGADGSNFGGSITISSGNGGNSNGYSGAGGNITMTSGDGGGVTTATGGNAGIFTMTSGDTGSTFGDTGKGGDFIMTSGAAGRSSFGQGGKGGDFVMSAGQGGNSGSSFPEGKGGDFNISGGKGAQVFAGADSGGDGGNLYLKGGLGGNRVISGTSGDGGNIYIRGGTAGTGGTGQVDGDVIMDVGEVLIGMDTPFSGGNGSSVLQITGNVSINGTLFTFSPTDESYTPLTRGNQLPDSSEILDADGHLNKDLLFDKEVVTDTWVEYPYTIEQCGEEDVWNEIENRLDEGVYICRDVIDTSRPIYKSQQKTDPFQIFFNNRLILSELFMVQNIVNTTNYGNIVDFDNGIMVENIFTQSKVINLVDNYALKFLNASRLDSKDTHKNKETFNISNQTTDVLNLENRTVDLEGAFSDHMTCMYLHPKYEDYRLCMLDVNPKEKIK